MDSLTEEEKKALRGSKFAPLPSPAPDASRPGFHQPRNKAAALAKFLERKLQDPNGSLDPKLVELAVNNAKQTVLHSGASTSGRIVHHVKDFGDTLSAGEEDTEDLRACTKKHKKKKKKKNQKKKLQKSENSVGNTSKRSKKKLKL